MASNQSRYHRFVAAICASLFVAADAHLSIPVTARRHALWRRPQAYARFLGIELSLAYKGPLLVAMPDGIGVSWPGHSSAAALASVSGVRVRLGGAAMLFGLDRRQRLGVLLPAVQKEFGLFANASIPNASIQYGRRVAFIGADANDIPGNARVFLRARASRQLPELPDLDDRSRPLRDRRPLIGGCDAQRRLSCSGFVASALV